MVFNSGTVIPGQKTDKSTYNSQAQKEMPPTSRYRLPGHRELTTENGEVVFQYVNATYKGSNKVDQVQVFKNFELTERRTKVVCTIGPANSSVETLVELLDAGMNVARVNFTNSMQNHEELRNLREAMASRPDRQYAILLEL